MSAARREQQHSSSAGPEGDKEAQHRWFVQHRWQTTARRAYSTAARPALDPMQMTSRSRRRSMRHDEERLIQMQELETNPDALSATVNRVGRIAFATPGSSGSFLPAIQARSEIDQTLDMRSTMRRQGGCGIERIPGYSGRIPEERLANFFSSEKNWRSVPPTPAAGATPFRRQGSLSKQVTNLPPYNPYNSIGAIGYSDAKARGARLRDVV
eukprot:m.25606 g.25606  ORF g.25606 m.25606 type:complete len:212 (-) comp4452_c0_seq2:142-777(-)